jgi:ATP-dependent helicase HepA
VRLPNSDRDFQLPQAQLRVRWDRPVQNPVDVLAAGATESPFFRDARLPMLRSLVAQRAACAGIASLLSSAVEIYPHQVQAALTVLSDPVMRYLLADEVGLGKTIEAGLVIRQVLLDDPHARIVLLAPETLRRQWQAELREKFFVDEFPNATLKISTHEYPERWSSYTAFDLVVVDEAHRLVQVERPDESPYRELASLAHSVARLLLLSATPVRSTQTTTYLGMLHLLDRNLYRWEDRESFQHRLDVRKALAAAVYSLDAEFAPLIPLALSEVAELIPSDPRFNELARSASLLLTEDGELRHEADREELTRRVEAVRAHLGETYRLHRRVIRHRRHQVLQEDEEGSTLPFLVRGRSRPKTLALDTAVQQAAQDALLRWQSLVGDWLRDRRRLDSAGSYGQVLAILASRADVYAGDLRDALRWRLLADADAAERAGLSGEERILLSQLELAPAESHVLEDLEAIEEHEEVAAVRTAVEALAPVVKDGKRVVIFCGPGRLATWLADHVGRALGDRPLVEHTQHAGPRASDQAVGQWRQYGAVLIVDATAEDGLNLQSADAVVHCRVPWSPNRLEQRLGRVDRHVDAPVAPAPSPSQYILGTVEGEYSFSGAWLALLDRGFGVFEESISTLQDAVEHALPFVWRTAVEDGPQGLVRCTEWVRQRLSEERKGIDSMDMLESIHQSATGLRDVASSIGKLETTWRDIDVALRAYAGQGPGGLRLFERRSSSPRKPLVRFDRGTVDPLMPPRLFARATRGVVPASMEGVFNRSVALRLPGTPLFRLGNPFVDMLAEVIAVDDRGQASAFWRRMLARTSLPRALFGVDYLVEASVTSALDRSGASPQARMAVRRQADRILEPFMSRVWVDAATETVVQDDRLVAALDLSYDQNRGDVNLNPGRIGSLVKLFGDWQRFGEAARRADHCARIGLAGASNLTTRCEQALARVRHVVAVAGAQARARQAAGRLLSDTEDFLTDVGVVESLADALSRPSVEPVSVTCLVLGDLDGGAGVG